MKNHRILVLLFLFTTPLFAQPEQSFEAVPGTEGLQVKRNIMIPAKDGIGLATDIYRMEGSKTPLPVVLQRTPYGKRSERFKAVVSHLAARGYIVALQDLRGRYDSEGLFSKYSPQEAGDGATTVEWLAKQEFCNGKVGMWGTSYGAHTQADASKLNPNGLAAMILNMGGMTNAWDHAVRQGGAFELGRELTWAFKQIPAEIKDPVVQKHFEKEKIKDWYTAWPFRRGLNPLSIAPNFEDYILEELTHSDYDEFWQTTGINWEEYFAQTADVPMVHVGGWYDTFLRGTIQNYVVLDSLQKTPKWLIIGPWTHSGNGRTYAGDVDFGAAASIDDFRVGYQGVWFDYLLKGLPQERIEPEPVQLFIMGTGDGSKNAEGRLNHGGYWRGFDTWPPPEIEGYTLYLGADGSLQPHGPSTKSSSTTFTFDPNHPVPTLGGNVSARVKDGAFNQRERPDFVGSRPPYLPIRARQDVVVFQTPPLEEDICIGGPIEVELHVSSDAIDTDFTVKLLDIYPPSEDFPEGFDLNLTDGIVRMSYRNGRHTRDLITPGQVYTLKIDLFPTANVFKKGHRIRVDVSSSNFPRWDVNPNTGEPLGKHRRMVKANNTIYHSSEHPSRIRLSTLPKKE
ncbi:MAG: CocE/NonD family hydrolase [Saprospiraceae bacterium]|nr:CocE/NonD family hydrolase [Saprospiraceae bacterium]